MAKQSINVGATANDKKGDSLRAAFQKVNNNFTELYTALGLAADANLNLGAFEFTGSVMTTTDSSGIIIDQAVTVTSDLTVSGDVVPAVAQGGDLGSPARPWKSLYVSNNTIFIGGTAVGIDANGNLTTNGTTVGGGVSTLVNGSKTVSLGSDGDLTLPAGGTILDSSGQPYVNGVSSINTSVSTSIFTDASGDYQYGTLSYDYAVNGVSNSFSIEYSRPLIGGNVDIHVGNTIVNGDLTLSGDIRSEGNINIDINLTDSTLRRWQFGEDGNLNYPDGTISTGGAVYAAANSSVAMISNNEHNQVRVEDDYAEIFTSSNGITLKTWRFSNTGNLTIPGDIQSEEDISIRINLADSTQRVWRFGEDGHLSLPAGGDIKDSTGTSVLGGGSSIPTVVTTGAVGVDGAAHAKVQFTVASAITVTAVGVTVIGVSAPANGTITLSGSPGTGAFDIVAVSTYTTPGDTYIFIPFATNASGTGYGAPIAGAGTNPCYVRGTLITMADMSRVAVENITYSDDILVWDFDLGEFASAKPLWIKKTQTTVVSCLLTFSDHSELRIVGDSPKAHRIFNKEAGRFTYGSMPETPIGTTTFNDQGEEITLISKQWIVGEVEFYNVMTDYHMNLFANSILTSMRYNNLYPITDMKFVKDGRTLRTADDYPNVEERLYKGFRLAEQTHGVEEIETHIQWLLSFEVERETECV